MSCPSFVHRLYPPEELSLRKCRRKGGDTFKEGRLVGESMHGVREGVAEEGKAQRERNEGGRGR